VGDMAPYQAFSIGGIGSVRGYGEGAVGSGRSCLVANSELTLPLVCDSFINNNRIMLILVDKLILKLHQRSCLVLRNVRYMLRYMKYTRHPL
jgi:hypothetical protein